MTLIYDDLNSCYVWVDTKNEHTELSPQFDTEEDAIQWYGLVAKIMFKEFGVTK